MASYQDQHCSMGVATAGCYLAATQWHRRRANTTRLEHSSSCHQITEHQSDQCNK
jgi:uncharacterized protein (UPF0303 family)